MFAARCFSAGLLWLLIVMQGTTSPVLAQDSLRYEYAVKVMCGAANRPAVAPGRYYTAVNIHNPSTRAARFRKKFALTGAQETALDPTVFVFGGLRPDYALEVDCTNTDLQRRGLVKGFAVIQSNVELDVVAV